MVSGLFAVTVNVFCYSFAKENSCIGFSRFAAFGSDSQFGISHYIISYYILLPNMARSVLE